MKIIKLNKFPKKGKGLKEISINSQPPKSIKINETTTITPNGTTTQIITPAPQTKRVKVKKLLFTGLGILIGAMIPLTYFALRGQPVVVQNSNSSQEFKGILERLPQSDSDTQPSTTTVYNNRQVLNVKTLTNWAQQFALHSLNNSLVSANRSLETQVADQITNYNNLQLRIKDKNNQIRQLVGQIINWENWWRDAGPIFKANREEMEKVANQLHLRFRSEPNAPGNYDWSKINFNEGTSTYLDYDTISAYTDWDKEFHLSTNLPTKENGGLQTLVKDDSA